MSRERAGELLLWRAVEGLDDDANRELAGLLAKNPDLDDDGFDYAAAACHLALLGPEEPMPGHVRQRLERAAAEFQGQTRGKLLQLPRRDAPAPDARFPRGARAGWLAAAACLLLALAGWWPRLTAPPAGEEPSTIAERPAPAPELSPELSPDAIELPWQATEDAAAVAASGSVIWSAARQAGVMRIRGLEANDPSVSQYQLWIFDKNRDERYPVDGGVFDIPAGATEAIVPIDAKVAVDEPALFAVTVERPGGVVVSGRERIVLLAQAAA